MDARDKAGAGKAVFSRPFPFVPLRENGNPFKA
jgi:hypothetical protein